MTFKFYTQKRRVAVAIPLCLAFLATIILLVGMTKESPDDVTIARQILPGYSFVFADHTNVIERCRNQRAFLRQHEMMEYLQIFAPYMQDFNHPTNHPIVIRETNDRVILNFLPELDFLRTTGRYTGGRDTN